MAGFKKNRRFRTIRISPGLECRHAKPIAAAATCHDLSVFLSRSSCCCTPLGAPFRLLLLQTQLISRCPCVGGCYSVHACCWIRTADCWCVHRLATCVAFSVAPFRCTSTIDVIQVGVQRAHVPAAFSLTASIVVHQEIIVRYGSRPSSAADLSSSAWPPPGRGDRVTTPRLLTTKISPEKIGLSARGGKTIKGIQEATDAKIDVDDDGTVYVAHSEAAGAAKVRAQVGSAVRGDSGRQGLHRKGRIDRLYFGQFRRKSCPAGTVLLHISEIDHFRVGRVDDVLRLGDVVEVEVIAIDDQNRVKLSRSAG